MKKAKRNLKKFIAALWRGYVTRSLQNELRENCGLRLRDGNVLPYYHDADANLKIKELLESGKPVMVSRWGSAECDVVYGVTILPFPFKKFNAAKACHGPGFFPCDKSLMPMFSEICLNAAREADMLGFWHSLHGYFSEQALVRRYSPNTALCSLRGLDPWFNNEPWSQCLAGKKVLVIHPFDESIRFQYENNRGKLFRNPKVLPEFKSLEIVKPPQGAAGNKVDGYATWFDALDELKRKVEETDFDVAIIGAGAYGMPLAAHCKRIGKVGIHSGGTAQLLFGIIGGRWEGPTYGYQHTLFNEHWKRPFPSETPAKLILEDGVKQYW